MASTLNSVLPPAEECRNWLDLPSELMVTILQRVPQIEILMSAQRVCKTWCKICKDPALWRVIDIRDESFESWPEIESPEKMTRHVVDLSRGQLVDLNLEDFGSDDLLKYVCDGSCKLRRLRLIGCYKISDEGLGYMVKKLPLLEELLIYNMFVSKQNVELFGSCCPQLKSFTLSDEYDGFTRRTPGYECDEVALAIAKNMPGLRHMQLCRNKMTNVGLEAILDKCPHLESLHLEQCYFVDLGADLGKRCSQQIKDFGHQCDSDDKDYGFDDHRATCSTCALECFTDDDDDDDYKDYYDEFDEYLEDDKDWFRSRNRRSSVSHSKKKI